MRQLVHTWKAGLDYALTPRTTVGVAVNGQAANSPQEGTNFATQTDASNRLTARYQAINLRTVRTPNVAATLTHTTPKTTLTAGLRAEQTNTSGQQEVGTESFPTRHYAQLFPSAAVRRSLSARHEMALSLSRRIDRPTYGPLNPFRIYIDATTYGTGNPGLRPKPATTSS